MKLQRHARAIKDELRSMGATSIEITCPSHYHADFTLGDRTFRYVFPSSPRNEGMVVPLLRKHLRAEGVRRRR